MKTVGDYNNGQDKLIGTYNGAKVVADKNLPMAYVDLFMAPAYDPIFDSPEAKKLTEKIKEIMQQRPENIENKNST